MTFVQQGAAFRRPLPGGREFNRSHGTIYVGYLAGVRRHKVFRGSLCAPLDVDPFSLVWPVQGAGVTLISTRQHEEFTTRLIQALLDDGAELVTRIREDEWTATFHRPPPKETP